VAEKLGGWPLIKGDSWNADDSWTWQEQVKKFRSAGFSMDYIIDFSIGVDLQNSTKRLIDVSTQGFLLTLGESPLQRVFPQISAGPVVSGPQPRVLGEGLQ